MIGGRRGAAIVPRWSQLRAIGNSGPAKLTILIPLVGYYIIFNAQLARYLDLITEIAGSTARPSSVQPRLLLIYFGLCAIAVGAALYSIFCPTEVKQYGSSAAYVGGDGPNIKDWAFELIEEELMDSSDSEYKDLRSRFDYTELLGDPKERKAEAQNGILHIYFRYKDGLYWIVRLLVLICCVIGFTCLIIPSLGVFVRVVRILWGTFPLSVLF